MLDNLNYIHLKIVLFGRCKKKMSHPLTAELLTY
jgi:hypothetical protein